MTDTPVVFDRKTLLLRRNRAAPAASSHAFLLERVADDLAERLAGINRTFAKVLDLGAHHGVVGARMTGLAGVEMVVAMDSAPRLLERCPHPKVLADEELLPFRDGALDLVVSGLSLHLVNDLPGTLVQIRRILRPDGLMLAALLGGQTLGELREAFLAAEAEVAGGASPRVAPFADVRELGALLQRAGFALPVVDSDTVTVTYPDPLSLIRDLRGMGATNALVHRHRQPMRRRTLVRALEIYHERFAGPDGRVPATFEIVTLTGWAPHESQQKPLRPGSAQAQLADVLGTPRRSTGNTAGSGESTH